MCWGVFVTECSYHWLSGLATGCLRGIVTVCFLVRLMQKPTAVVGQREVIEGGVPLSALKCGCCQSWAAKNVVNFFSLLLR